MSLINKMLQDLDKRHAADGGGKPLTQQLRPVPARRNWRRIMWEVGAGVIIGAGWAVWVLYQVSPRSVVTELAFQSQAKGPRGTARSSVPAGPQAQPAAAAPAAAVPAQAAAAPMPPAAAMPALPAAAGSAPSPAPVATRDAEPVRVDGLKFATEIATLLDEKGAGARPKAERKPVAESAPAAARARQAKSAPDTVAAAAPAPVSSSQKSVGSRAQGSASIDKQMRAATPAEGAENEFRKATGLLNQGRVAEAMDGYRSTLEHDAGHAAARQALVGLLLEHRRIDEAQQLLQQGLSLDPERSSYAMLSARIQVERGDLQGAHELLSKHAGGAANNADYQAFDAAVLQRLGRHREAVTAYQAALRLAPRAGVWWMGMGISLQADNRGADALDAFRRAKSAGGLSADLLAFVDQRLKLLQ